MHNYYAQVYTRTFKQQKNGPLLRKNDRLKNMFHCIIVQVCLMSQSWDNVPSMHDHLLTIEESTFMYDLCTNSVLLAY